MSKPVYCVEWTDAEAHAAWMDMEQIAKLKAPVAKSYGLILRRDKDVLVIAHSEAGDEYGVDVIPSGMVKKVTRLK